MSDQPLDGEPVPTQAGLPVPSFPATPLGPPISVGLPFPVIGGFATASITLPKPSPFWVVWLIAILLALGITPDVIGLLLALIGLAPFVWPEATR